MTRVGQLTLASLLTLGALGTASAAATFQGRLADGTASNCAVSGAGKCAMFYNATLNITILNDWNIGTGPWSAIADAGSAQPKAASAGCSQTSYTGWVLPTIDGTQSACALNRYRLSRNDAGGTADLRAQFDGVLSGSFWSGTHFRRGRTVVEPVALVWREDQRHASPALIPSTAART